MKRTILLAPILIAASAAAGPIAKLPAQPAEKGPSVGCTLFELSATSTASSVQRPDKYDPKQLLAASADLPAADPKDKPELEQVWSWCITPSLGARVWAACKGTGDSRSCGIYAAYMHDGKLGSIASHGTGWKPPRVERVDSKDAPASLWSGSGLKVTISSAKGDSTVGMYMDAKNVVHFTAEEK
jgi:hypothetical protein